MLIWLIRRKRKRRKKRRRKRRKRRKNKCEVFYQILKIIMSSFKLIIAFQLFTTRTRNLSCQAPATLSAFFHQCGHLSKPISLSSNNLSAISSAYMIIRDTFLAIASTISGNLLLPQNSLPPLSSVLENSLASHLSLFLSFNLNYLVGGVSISLKNLLANCNSAIYHPCTTTCNLLYFPPEGRSICRTTKT